jgi:hypothetical protein
MAAELLRLIYVSHAVRPLTTAELDLILLHGRRNNVRDGITGMLVYASGNFMQVLEGPPPAVEATFARISRDSRHQGIIEIERDLVEARSFAGWSMGFRRVESDGEIPAGFLPLFHNTFETAELPAKPGVALDMLRYFVNNQRG